MLPRSPVPETVSLGNVRESIAFVIAQYAEPSDPIIRDKYARPLHSTIRYGIHFPRSLSDAEWKRAHYECALARKFAPLLEGDWQRIDDQRIGEFVWAQLLGPDVASMVEHMRFQDGLARRFLRCQPDLGIEQKELVLLMNAVHDLPAAVLGDKFPNEETDADRRMEAEILERAMVEVYGEVLSAAKRHEVLSALGNKYYAEGKVFSFINILGYLRTGLLAYERGRHVTNRILKHELMMLAFGTFSRITELWEAQEGNVMRYPYVTRFFRRNERIILHALGDHDLWSVVSDPRLEKLRDRSLSSKRAFEEFREADEFVRAQENAAAIQMKYPPANFPALMRHAVEAAKDAATQGAPSTYRSDKGLDDFPVGAVVVYFGDPSHPEGLLIGKSGNRTYTRRDSERHAERLAMQDAHRSLRKMGIDQRGLEHCVLVSTHEPCTMCAPLIAHNRFTDALYAVSRRDHHDGFHVEGEHRAFTLPPESALYTILKERPSALVGKMMTEEVLRALHPTG